MKKQEEPVQRVDGAFLRALQEHNGGMALTDAAEAMRKVVDAVRRIGKTGSMSVDVYVEPTGGKCHWVCRGSHNQVTEGTALQRCFLLRQRQQSFQEQSHTT